MRIMNMNIQDTSAGQKRCGLCGQPESEVNVLVAGVSTYICDECVARSSRLLDSYADVASESIGDGTVEVLLSPGIDFNIESEALRQLLTRTAFAMADEDARTYLRGTLIEFGRERLRTVATKRAYPSNMRAKPSRPAFGSITCAASWMR